MASTENNRATVTFIGTTTYSAGIFLSRKIVERLPYAKHVKLERFDSFEQAYMAFKEKYEAVVDISKLRLNILYQVRDKAEFSVFWNWCYVGLLYTFNHSEALEKVLPDSGFVFWKHNMTKEDAIRFAKSRFVAMTGDWNLYINFRVEIYKPVSIQEVKKGGKS